MREKPKILSLATALAALATPATVPLVANAADHPDGPQIGTDIAGQKSAEAEVSLLTEVDLMSFTVHQAGDGTLFPQHGSHSSHSSHSSHVSHASSSPGFGVPDLPPIYVPPIYPPPVVSPPAVTPPAESSPTTTQPPEAASDIVRHACTRASSGLGVNQISSELQLIFGVTPNEAANVATQALAAVLVGGSYCDGYLNE